MHKDEWHPVISTFLKLQTNPTNNSFQNYTRNYDGKTKVNDSKFMLDRLWSS